MIDDDVDSSFPLSPTRRKNNKMKKSFQNEKPNETIFDADFSAFARDALHYGENLVFDKTYCNIPTRSFGRLTWRVQCTRAWTQPRGIQLTLSLQTADRDAASAAAAAAAPLKMSVRIELEQIVPDYCYNERLKLNYVFLPNKCMTLGPLQLVSEAEIESLQNADFSSFRSPQSWQCPKCHQWQDTVQCNDCCDHGVFYCFFCREGRVFISTPSNSSCALLVDEKNHSDFEFEDGENNSLCDGMRQKRRRRSQSLPDTGRENQHSANNNISSTARHNQQQRCPECNAFNINSLRFTFLNPHGNLRCWIKIDAEKQTLVQPTIVAAAVPHIAAVHAWQTRDTELMRKLADCQVEAEGVFIPAHMAILASRSSYFQSLLQTHRAQHQQPQQTSRRRGGTVSSVSVKAAHTTLTWSLPCSLAVAKMLLYHLYTDEMPHIPAVPLAYELLRMADLHQLTRLKTQCEAYLYTAINKVNACQMALVADCAHATQLCDYAVNYCQWNLKSVMQSPEWAVLCSPEYSHLAAMITTGVRRQ